MESALTKACILKIPNFEGPFDLLFHLIEKNRLEIHDIPISLVTEQYIQYLDEMVSLDMEIASEFLLMASTLLQIKSRMLLPEEPIPGTEPEDPREELVRRLVLYRKFREISHDLKDREAFWSQAAYKPAEPLETLRPEDIVMILDLDASLLQETAIQVFSAYAPALEDTAPKMAVIMQREKVSVRAKIEEILRFLTRRIHFVFRELFRPGVNTREEIVTGFSALLELSRAGRLSLEQEEPFSDILVRRRSKKHEHKTDDERY